MNESEPRHNSNLDNPIPVGDQIVAFAGTATAIQLAAEGTLFDNFVIKSIVGAFALKLI